jgi:hypothetical protein
MKKKIQGLILIITFLIVIKPCVQLNDLIFLVVNYDYTLIKAQDLHLVSSKPVIVVSNGDVYSNGATFMHFLCRLFLILISLGLVVMSFELVDSWIEARQFKRWINHGDESRRE